MISNSACATNSTSEGSTMTTHIQKQRECYLRSIHVDVRPKAARVARAALKKVAFFFSYQDLQKSYGAYIRFNCFQTMWDDRFKRWNGCQYPPKCTFSIILNGPQSRFNGPQLLSTRLNRSLIRLTHRYSSTSYITRTCTSTVFVTRQSTC